MNFRPLPLLKTYYKVWVVCFSFSIIISMTESSLAIRGFSGPGPVVISRSWNDLTCISSGNYNITWEIPALNFAELADQEVGCIA